LKKLLIIAGSCLLVAIVVFGTHYSARADASFWKDFLPNLWANIIGVSVGAIVGIPVGLMINHLIERATESRLRSQQVSEVRQLLEQVRIELNTHSTLLFVIAQNFMTPRPAAGASGTVGAPTIDVSPMMLRVVSEEMCITNSSLLLRVGQSLILFRISAYYARVAELNTLLNWYRQNQTPLESRDRRIGELGNSIALDRPQLEYETQQTIQSLTQGS